MIYVDCQPIIKVIAPLLIVIRSVLNNHVDCQILIEIVISY